jgi:hypothetical protein
MATPSWHPSSPSTQHTNVSSIDVQDIFPPYTVANITAMILNREREAGSKADIYLDRKDAMPAAAAGCGLGGQLGKERSPWVGRERIEKRRNMQSL